MPLLPSAASNILWGILFFLFATNSPIPMATSTKNTTAKAIPPFAPSEIPEDFIVSEGLLVRLIGSVKWDGLRDGAVHWWNKINFFSKKIYIYILDCIGGFPGSVGLVTIGLFVVVGTGGTVVEGVNVVALFAEVDKLKLFLK